MPIFCVGAQLPPSMSVESTIDEAVSWLDVVGKEHGEKSVAYVSSVPVAMFPNRAEDSTRFGSLFFAPTDSQIPALISVLAKRGKPSLLVSGNCTPEIVSVLKQAVEEKGQGLVKLFSWVTQQVILRHPVRFLTLGSKRN